MEICAKIVGMTTSAFAQNNQILTGIIYDRITEHETFTHVHSVFPDEWYNFIVPKVGPQELNWEDVKKVVQAENLAGYSLSYYVPDELKQAYKLYFLEQGQSNESESDFAVFATNQISHQVPGSLELVTSESVDEFVRMDILCFPGWDNSENYCRHFFELQEQEEAANIRNYFYRVNNQIVGFGAIVLSRSLNLAYIHNTGILPEHRRQGHFTNLIRHLMNVAVQAEIAESFALVDDGGASQLGLQKLGFEARHKNYLFEMK